MDLTGKVAVVTGSGRGLGLAYATELARSGAAVVVNDVDEAVAEAAVKTITDAGGAAGLAPSVVSQPASRASAPMAGPNLNRNANTAAPEPLIPTAWLT